MRVLLAPGGHINLAHATWEHGAQTAMPMQFVHSLTLLPLSLTYFLIGGDARREGTTAVFSLSSIYISAKNDGRAYADDGESRSLGGLFASASCKRPTASLLDGRREGVN